MKVRLGPIVGSLVAHSALAIVVARSLHRAPEVRTVDTRMSTDDQVEVEIVRMQDISDPNVRASATTGPDVRAAATGRPDVRASAIVRPEIGHGPDATGLAPDATGRAPNGAPARPGSLYMHMRGPELHLSDGEADGILDHPLGPPPEVFKSGRLENAPGGAGAIHDAVTVVTVERDGTAHFHDEPDIDIHFHLPIDSDWVLHPDAKFRATKQEIGKALRDWYADPEKLARGGHPTDLPEHLQAMPGQCDEWTNTMCRPEPMPLPQTGASGKFDLTAYLMRKLGVGDPFASRKRALLDSTIYERADRGARFRGEQLERSAELVRRNLQQLWAATSDAALRREALFEIWDECAEGDGPLGEAGQRARAEVIGWIGAHLPKGAAGAYSEDELATLARRRTSKQAFAPYEVDQSRAFEPPPTVVESGDVGSAGSAR